VVQNAGTRYFCTSMTFEGRDLDLGAIGCLLVEGHRMPTEAINDKRRGFECGMVIAYQVLV